MILLAACAAPAGKVTPLSRTPEEKVGEPKSIEIPAEPAPVVVPPVAAAPEPTVVALPASGWLSLSDWCAQNHFPAPLVTANATQTNVEIRAENGTFVFEPPRRNARWNGTLVGVGFPLQFTNKQAWIHSIDINKVLQPLLLTSNAPDRKRGGIVVIDAGHGGTNFGTLSVDRKWHEKELTLDWAKRVQRLLEGSQWKAVLTREGDMDLGLTQRVMFAEMKKADLFISLHFNSVSNAKEQAGLETYCLTPLGMASHLLRGYADEVGTAFPNNHFDTENLLLAVDVHRAILKKTGAKDRGIKRARFMTVLRDQRRPSVLIEGGFLSNPDEAKKIESSEYRQKLAEAVVEALGVTPPTFTTLRQ